MLPSVEVIHLLISRYFTSQVNTVSIHKQIRRFNTFAHSMTLASHHCLNVKTCHNLCVQDFLDINNETGTRHARDNHEPFTTPDEPYMIYLVDVSALRSYKSGRNCISEGLCKSIRATTQWNITFIKVPKVHSQWKQEISMKPH